VQFPTDAMCSRLLAWCETGAMYCTMGRIICAMAIASGAGCMTGQPSDGDTAYREVALPQPYAGLPANAPIEAGTPVVLDTRQQEAVVAGVIKWLKDPRAVGFGALHGARNSHRIVTVCGQVTGRTDSGAFAGPAPFIGVLMGSYSHPDFVVVGIGGSPRTRGEVVTLCRDSGITAVQ